MIKVFATRPLGRRVAAWTAVLLAASASAARCTEPEDTVRVEWVASANGALVILNAYAVRGGKPVPVSVRGLLIERDPSAVATSAPASLLYQFTGLGHGYATVEASPFLRALGLSETTLDTLANSGSSSDAPNQFDVQEWARLLNRLLGTETTEIEDGGHRLIVEQVAVPVQRVFADDLKPLFSGHDHMPVLPHLRSGRIAISHGPDGGARTDSISFGSISLPDTGTTKLYLKNYGVRQVKSELRVSDPVRRAGFSADGVDTLAIPAGDSLPVSLLFAPKQAGPHSGTIDFLVDGESKVQVIVTGEGVSLSIGARAWKWIAARADLLVGLIAFTLAVLIGWKRGVTLRLPWRPKPKAPGDAAVRQRLVAARHAIDELLAELRDEPVSTPGGSQGDDRRRLRALEREREEWGEARSRLEASVETITAERNGLDERVRTLEGERTRLTQQASELETVQAENGRLHAQNAAAQETVAGFRRDVNRLSCEQEKLALRLRAVAEVLDLSDEMVSDAGWPETERRLPALRDGGKPRYLWNFEQLVADLSAIFEEIEPRAGEGRLAAAVSAVLGGSNNNAGLRTVAAELKRESLVARLGLGHPRELRTLGAERFYREFVDRQFRPIIDNIAKLGLYARSRSPEFGMGQRLSREGVDPALLERALALVESRMRQDFGVDVHMVRLFEERFDRSRHDTASHSTLRHTLPDLEASIRRLPPETIYDITSVGLRSDRLGVSVRPVVAWV